MWTKKMRDGPRLWEKENRPPVGWETGKGFEVTDDGLDALHVAPF